MHSLITQGAALDAVDNEGRTLLFWALIYNKPKAFEVLLKSGGDPTIHNTTTGATVIHSAAETLDHPEYLKMLFHYGAPANIEDNGGATPLFYAMGSPAYVQLLINHGADINHQDIVGDTPLHMAALADDYKDVLVLLKAGANYTVQNNQGVTFQGYLRTDMPEKLFSDKALEMRDKIRTYLREHDIPVKF